MSDELPPYDTNREIVQRLYANLADHQNGMPAHLVKACLADCAELLKRPIEGCYVLEKSR